LAFLQNDKDAILELTLQQLKKDAAKIANEYSLVESHVADHFNNGGRSDSRAWNSEYDEKYPDYTTSVYKKDIYLTQNPNRLTKSSLVNPNPQIRRGPRSAKSKIYYWIMWRFKIQLSLKLLQKINQKFEFMADYNFLFSYKDLDNVYFINWNKYNLIIFFTNWIKQWDNCRHFSLIISTLFLHFLHVF
jgi:hypothetical protein